MASSESRRRKQLEKKKKKRAVKHHHMTVRRNAGMGDQILQRVKAPIYECLVSVDFEVGGLGEVIISRGSRSGEIATSLFLIDRHCMGVKDCFSRIFTAGSYREFLCTMADRERVMRKIDSSSARRLVEDAVAYADSLGLKPHQDYRAAKLIFGDINPDQATELFEMGRDGKPFFMSGPFQSPAECAAIVAKLTERCGEGGFDYMMAVGPLDEWGGPFFDDDDESDEFDDDSEMTDWTSDADSEKPQVIVIDPAA